MRTKFPDIIEAVLEAEGGYVHHPADRGGETNMGISASTFPDEDIELLSEDKERAIDLYREHYWKPSRAEQLPEPIRHFYFDMVVHHGQRNAVRILQRALRQAGYQIKIDGIIGPETIRIAGFAGDISNEVILHRVRFMNEIVTKDGRQSVFLHGWINRALSFFGAQ